MKDFQNAIQYYLLNHEKQKKYLAVVLALSMLVTFIVPLILTQSAESMTRNNSLLATQLAQVAGNETLHPESCTDASCTDTSHAYSEVDLLVGKNSELRGATIEETIRNANATYAIGIASQFCVFLDGDFTTTDADAEGRVAVSGSVDGANWDTWYYEIGNGDWYTRVGLDVLLNDSGYAHVISNGSSFQHVNVSSGAAAGDHPNWEVQGKHYSDANGNRGAIFKRLQVGTNTAITGYNDSTDLDHFYRTDTFSVAEQFGTEDSKGMLLQRSEKLSQNASNGEITFGEINDNGSTVKVAYLTYTGTDPNAESIFFNFTEEQWAEFVECTHVKYVNIPLLDEPREVVENDGSTSTWDTAYIVINVPGTEVHLANPDTHNGQKFTSITSFGSTEEKWISREGTSDNDYSANNHPGVSSLLYNFYQAKKLVIANNFQGTLLAPMAHATDEFTEMQSSDGNKRGHLSGALIAKSFDGATEFGYRPYTGPISILGSTSGYTIPVDKFKTDGTTRLSGADFSLTIKDVTDEPGTVVTSWKSGEDTEYVTIPTMLDFTGGETYTEANMKQSRTYTVKEISAPSGYIGTEKKYTLTVKETVDLTNMIASENGGTIPTNVNVEITITPEIPDGETNAGSTASSTLTFSISDVYDGSSQTMRKITIDGEEFWLLIKEQKVVGMVQPTGETEMVCSEYDGTVTYKTMITTSTEIVHESLVTETSYTDVPLLDAEGSVVTNENSETVMSTSAVEYPKTVAVETETKTVTNENNEPVLDEAGSTIMEVVVLSTDTVTETYTEISEFDIESDAWKNTTYTTSVGIPATTSLVADPAALATNGVLTFGDTTETTTRYYFDQNSLILMPLPAQNLNFINEYGFVFEKTDEDGNPVTGATIALEKKLAEGETEPTEESELDANNGYQTIQTITSSSITLNPDTLDADTLYRFRESVVPSGYEEADPIYVVKFDDGSIAYLQSEAEPTDIPTSFDDAEVKGWSRFQINEYYTRTIRMEDQKIHGAKLILNKQDSSNGTPLDGAFFELHAANGDLVYPVGVDTGFEIPDGELDLFAELKNAAPETYDSAYVNDGYLVKGTYYLEEVQPPEGYENAGVPFRFRVNLVDGEYVIEALSSDDTTPEYISKEEGHSYYDGEELYFGDQYSGVKITKIEVDISEITNQDSHQIQFKPVGDKSEYQVSLDNIETTNTFTPENLVFGDGGRMKITFWNVKITDIRFYVDESTVGGSSSSDSGTATAYDIAGIVWNSEGNSSINVDELTLYYSDGSSSMIEDVTWSGSNYWYPFDLKDLRLTGVTAVQIKTSGSGTFKLLVRDTSWEKDVWSGDVTAGQTYTFGTIPTTSETTAPETTAPSEETTTAVVNTATLETNTDGELVIPNSRLGADVSISVQKEWSGDEDCEFARPGSITVDLYQATSIDQVAAKGGTLYQTLTLNAENGWAQTLTLPRLVEPDNPDNNNIYYYYVKEIDAPAGYTVSYRNNDGETVKDGGIIHVVNTLEPISISVKKDWDKPNGASTPSSVNVKLQYSADGQTGWTDLPDSQQTLNSGNNWTYSYEGLPSNYFYKAVEVNVPNGWVSTDSAASQTDGAVLTITNKLITGKIRLLKNWENDDAKHRPSDVTVKLYRTISRGTGSGGGSSSGGGSAEGDTTGGNTEVSENAVVASFLYQKGNGSVDHDTYWGPPEDQPSRTDQMYWTTNSASDIAASYAATLAQFAVNFPDDAKSENYLNAAKALYDFSTKYNSCATEYCSGFYPSTSCTDEQAWAAAWLYLATNDTTYKTECETKLSACGNPEERGYFWDDVMLGAEAVYAAHIDDTPSWTKVTNYLNTYCTGDDFRVLNQWGSARHNALLQTLALVTDKNMGTENYQAWCKNQMAFILGSNNYNKNFVIGFADNSIKNPHHKAATGTVLVDTANGISWDGWNNWNGIFGEESHVLVGALASGPRNGNVSDNCKSPEGNEVALDYNAGLVGAAAGLYSVYGTGTLVNNGADIDSEVESKYDGFTVTTQPTYTSNITEDYSRLLQYSLYFYDANMCGDFTEENSAFSWRQACHTDDTVDGGFHDAGDHVMFGLPQGFSASTLGWVYYEFKNSFDSLGQTAHYKTIMEEFCDFFVDSIQFAETSQQTLTLSNTLTPIQSQKATALKGISQVGSEKVAKAGANYVSVNPISSNGAGVYDLSTSLNGISVTSIELVFDNAGWVNGRFRLNDSWDTYLITHDAQLSSNTLTLNFSSLPDSITSLSIEAYWFSANITEIRFHYNGGDVFTITATPNSNILLGGTAEMSYANAPDGTASVVYTGDTNLVSINGSTITALKPGTVTITGTAYDSSNTALGDPVTTTISITEPTLSVPSSMIIGESTSIQVTGNAPANGSIALSAVGGTVASNSDGTFTFTADNKEWQNNNVTITASYNGTEYKTYQIYITPLSFTNNPTEMTLGGDVQFSVNKTSNVKWSSSDSTVAAVDENTGMVTGVAVGTVRITATDTVSGASVSADITVKDDLVVSIDKTTIRVGKTAALSPVSGVEYKAYVNGTEDTTGEYVSISGNVVTANKAGTVTITGTRNGTSSSVTLTIQDALTITGDNTMNAGETQTLTVTGIIGNLTWVSDSDAVTVDQNGYITANANGTAIITVTDAGNDVNSTDDDATATFTISVEQSAVDADIPSDAVWIADIKITGSGDSWSNNEVVAVNTAVVTSINLEELPLTDGNGNTYYYYIEEILADGDRLVTDTAVYVPSAYVGNGSALTENAVTDLSVTNTLKSEVESDGRMPSAGGEGTTWYYMAGAAMMLAGIAGYFVLKRKQVSER